MQTPSLKFKKTIFLINNKAKEPYFAIAFEKETRIKGFNVRVLSSLQTSLFYSREKQSTSLYIDGKITPTNNTDWFVRAWSPSEDATALLCLFLEQNKIPFTDKKVNTAHEIRTSKLSQTFQLAAHNCACPSTWVMPINQFSKNESEIIKQLKFPIIVKARGGLGQRVWKCANKTGLRNKVKELKTEGIDDLILFQENIENIGDIRVIVFQNKIIASIGRSSTNGFLNNVSQGGVADSIKISKKEVLLALKSAKSLGLELAGVDIVRSIYGPLVFEVNKAPDITSFSKAAGFDIDTMIARQYLN